MKYIKTLFLIAALMMSLGIIFSSSPTLVSAAPLQMVTTTFANTTPIALRGRWIIKWPR